MATFIDGVQVMREGNETATAGRVIRSTEAPAA